MEVRKMVTENPILVAKTEEEMRKAVAGAGLTNYVSGKLPDGTFIVASTIEAESAAERLGDKLKGTLLEQARMISEELARMHQET